MAKPPYSQGVGPGFVAPGSSATTELLIFPPPGAPDTIVIRNMVLNITAIDSDNVTVFVSPTIDPTVLPFRLGHLQGQTQDADATIDLRYVMDADSHLWVTYNGAGPGFGGAAVM